MSDVAEFRRRARAWLEANAPRKADADNADGEPGAASIAEQKAFQAKLRRGLRRHHLAAGVRRPGADQCRADPLQRGGARLRAADERVHALFGGPGDQLDRLRALLASG